MTLGFDIDGLLADFNAAFLPFARAHAVHGGEDWPASPEHVTAYSYGISRERIIGALADFPLRHWLDEIQPYEGAVEFVRRVGVDYYITARPSSVTAQTCSWLMRHGFPDAPLIHAEDKATACAAAKIDILVEDSLDNAISVAVDRRYHTRVILLDRPYNQSPVVREGIYRAADYEAAAALVDEVGRVLTSKIRLGRVVGLTGFARAGKDSVGDVLSDHGYERISFADPLREFIIAVNPLLLNENGEIERYADLMERLGYEEAKKNPEVRRLLQATGTDAGRNIISDTVWSDIGKRRAEDILAEGGMVYFPDVRFDNEIDAVKDLGGQTGHVSRNGYGRVNDHVSEDLAEAFERRELVADVYIANDGSLDDLHRAVSRMIP